MVQEATASKPAHSSQLGEDEPPRDSMATAGSHDAPLTERALQRHYSRQEPSAVVPHAGNCAGGRSKERSLPRSQPGRRGHYEQNFKWFESPVQVDFCGFWSTHELNVTGQYASP